MMDLDLIKRRRMESYLEGGWNIEDPLSRSILQKKLRKLQKTRKRFLKSRPDLKGVQNLDPQYKSSTFGTFPELIEEAKKPESGFVDETPEYTSGKSDDYYEFEMRGEKIRIYKPKKPLVELKEEGKKLPDKSISEIRKDISEKMKEELRE